MRAAILSVLALCCAVCCCAAANENTLEVSQEDWKRVSGRVQPFLDELAEKQGHHFKLVKLIEMKDVPFLDWDGEFENDGEKRICSFQIQRLPNLTTYIFDMNCDNGKTYQVELPVPST